MTRTSPADSKIETEMKKYEDANLDYFLHPEIVIDMIRAEKNVYISVKFSFNAI